MKPLEFDRPVVIALVLTIICAAFFGKYLRRAFRDWYRKRHPGSYKEQYGRFGGRFFTSAVGLVLSLLLLALGSHLSTDWLVFDQSMMLGKVTAAPKGGGMELTVELEGLPSQTVQVEGNYWVVRWEVLQFNPRLRLLGLRNYSRIRTVDGIARPEDRIVGAAETRQELAPQSFLFAMLQKVPYTDWIATVSNEVSPAKKPRGEVEVWTIPGGSAG